MPRAVTLQHPLLVRLAQELRMVSRDALLRDVERIELLVRDLDPAQVYPWEWIVFRVTGYRPDDASSPDAQDASHQSMTGSELLRESPALAEHLCTRASLREHEATGCLAPASLCTRWQISASTFARLRLHGLVCRVVLTCRGIPALRVREDVAAWFEREHGAKLSNTRGKRRLSPSLRARLVREALRYRRVLGASPHAISVRLAQRHRKDGSPSEQAIRALLATNPATRTHFAIKRHAQDRSRLAMLRLSLRGALPEAIAKLSGKRTPAVRRDLALARASLLRRWSEAGLMRPLEGMPESRGLDEPGSRERGKPAPPAQRQEADTCAWPDQGHDLADVLVGWRARRALLPAEERALLASLSIARDKAHTLERSLDRLHPSPVTLDETETQCRSASILHRKLVAGLARLVLDTIDVRTQSPCEQLPISILLPTLHAGLRALADAAWSLDPSRGGRVAGAAGLAIDRAVVRSLREHGWAMSQASLPGGGQRASARLVRGVDAQGLLWGLAAWERWLFPPPQVLLWARGEWARGGRILDASATTDDATTLHESILALRYGLRGQAPMTLGAIQARLRGTHPRLTSIQLSREACLSLRRLAMAYNNRS